MQPKVSMVIACFNKEQYIGELLDSIIGQSWRNMQLILVNDGSTDGTGKVLAEYKPKLLERGIETIIMEQENTGVALAVRNGLEQVSGDFVCMPDADDVLCPDYVEHMAGWLYSHPETKWTVCDSDHLRWTQCINECRDEPCDMSQFENLLERYILMCNFGMVWALMIRTEYLREVNVISCLSLLGWTTTHESPVWLPVILGKGKGMYLPSRLYRFRVGPITLSNPGSVEKVLGYARRYRDAIIKVLEFCGVKEQKYYFLAMLRELEEIVIHASELKEYACRKLSDILIRNQHIEIPIDPNTFYIDGENPHYGFLCWLWSNFIPHIPISTNFTSQLSMYPKGDVIAYGALGARATRLLPIWNATRWKPTKLWDKCGSGLFVTKPDFLSLKENDTVLVFPTNPSAIAEIKTELDNCEACVLYAEEMDILLKDLYQHPFPMWRSSALFNVLDEEI